MNRDQSQDHRWRFPLAILFFANFVGFWNLLLLSPLQPFVAADLGISIGKAAQLTTVSAASAVVSLVLFGRYGARLPRRWTIRIGIAALTLGSLLLLLTDNYTWLMAIRVLNGVADGVIYPAAWVAVSEYLPRNKRALGITWIVVGTGAAGVFGLPITSLFIGDGDWQASVQIFVYAGAAMFLLSLFLPKPTSEEQETKVGGVDLLLEILVRNTRLRTAAYANVAGDVSWFGALIFLGSFLVRFHHPSLRELSLFFLVASVFFVFGSFINSPSAKLQRRIAMVSSFGVVVMAVVFFSLTGSYTLTVVLAAAYALVRAPGIVAMDTLLLELSEGTITRVAAGALTNIITALGTLVGAALGGLILDATAFRWIGVSFAAFSLISFLFLWLLKLPQQEPEGQAS